MVRQPRVFESALATTPAVAECNLKVKPERAAVRVCPIGEIDLGSIEPLRSQLKERDGFQRIILDLRETTFLDSSGLRLIVEVYEASAAGCGPPGRSTTTTARSTSCVCSPTSSPTRIPAPPPRCVRAWRRR
jgi:hypothetical protein